MILILLVSQRKPAPCRSGVQHDEVQILAVELVFRIHLLVMSLKGKAYEEAPLVLCIVLQIA